MRYQLKSVNIELTNKCNLKCKMCYRNHMTDREGSMSKKLFLKIIKDLQGIEGIEEIYLHWRGEPTMSELLPEAVRIVKQMLNSKVIIFTNSTLLNKGKMQELMAAKVDSINFSLDADSKDAYEGIRGVNCFETVKENILIAAQTRKEGDYKTKLFIYGVVLEENMLELLKLKRDFENIVDELFLKYDMRKESPTRGVPKNYWTWPFNNLLICWDGEVAPCCVDVNHDYRVGNVKNNSVREIFDGVKFSLLREKIQNGTPIEICEQCGFGNNK